MNTLIKMVEAIRRWHVEGKEAALATLIRSSGTTPLPVGEMMAVSSAMDMQGAVSRGCVEGAIVEIAQEVMKEGQAVLRHFGFSDQNAWEVGLTCGGEIDVLIEPFPDSRQSLDFFERMVSRIENEEPFYLLHFLDAENIGKKLLFDDKVVFYDELQTGLLSVPVKMKVENEVSVSKTVEFPLANGQILPAFVQFFCPADRVIIVGASEIAIFLTRMAKMLGFTVVIVDPRAMFATRVRFPEADIILPKWPQDCLPSLKLKKQDALVVISHDEKIDLPALQIGLENPIAYIGLLGSLKTRRSRFAALKEAGWQESDLSRLHAPIGLDIGSKRAEEIALSIIGEIVKERHKDRSV